MLDAISVKWFKECVCISKSLPGSDSIYKSSICSWKKSKLWILWSVRKAIFSNSNKWFAVDFS